WRTRSFPGPGRRWSLSRVETSVFPYWPPCLPPPGMAGSERSGRRRGEDRDSLFDLGVAALRAGVLFFTLCVTAHHLKEFTTFRAFELIDRHGARPPEPSIRPVASDLTLDRESLSAKP